MLRVINSAVIPLGADRGQWCSAFMNRYTDKILAAEILTLDADTVIYIILLNSDVYQRSCDVTEIWTGLIFILKNSIDQKGNFEVKMKLSNR